MTRMMRIGDILDAVGNTHIILVFSQTTMSMEVNQRTEVTFVKGNVHVNTFSWLKVNGINCFSFVDSCIFFCVEDCTWCFVYFLRTVFFRPYRVWWRHIYFMTLSEGWSIRWQMIYHEMGCFLKELLMIGFMGRVMM